MTSTPTSAPRRFASHRSPTAGAAIRSVRSPLLLFSVLSLFLSPNLCAPLAAQYTAPGRPIEQGGIPLEEALQDSYEAARWNLGRLRLSPWLGLRDVAFVSNVTERLEGEGEDDFTTTVGAGLRAYLRTGPKVLWAAQALPEYTWWQDTEAKRRLNGRYGLGVFGYFNRLVFEASARRVETQRIFTPELQQLTSTRQEVLRLAVDFEFVRRFHLVLSNEIRDFENQETENPVFSRLDREHDAAQAMVRYQTPRFSFGLGFEDGSTTFSDQARRLSNTETATLAEWTYTGPRIEAFLDLSRLSREPEPGSEFQAIEETTGHLDLLFKVGVRTSLLTYARRDLFYSIAAGNSSVLSSRLGARFEISGRRAFIAWFVEQGDDDFGAGASSAAPRNDDVTAAGLDLGFKFRRLLQLGVRLSNTEYDSNFDPFDREFLTLGATIELGGVLEKLRLGKEGDDW